LTAFSITGSLRYPLEIVELVAAEFAVVQLGAENPAKPVHETGRHGVNVVDSAPNF
jgi:hypothetical protein